MRHIVAIALAAALVWASSFLWLRYLPDSLVYFWDLREARGTIERIETFRHARGVPPADLCALNLPCDESAHLQYSAKGDNYVLWFGAGTYGFFATLGYDSSSKGWTVSHN